MTNNERNTAMRGVLLVLSLGLIVFSGCGAPPSPSSDTQGTAAQGSMTLAYTDSTNPKCAYCHTSQADSKYQAYGPSVHNTIAAATKNSSGDVRQKCSKCHTDEGAKLYVDNTPSQLTTSVALAGASTIQCDTCHDSHGFDNLLEAAGTDKFTNTASDQYMTCTNCHEEQGALHGETSSHEYTAGIFDPAGIIYDTHFDNAATDGIEGYIINSASENACRECHNVHSADISKNEQWARSAHGGFILDVKEQAFLNAPGSATANANVVAVLTGTDQYGALRDNTPNYNAPAWSHYDFKSGTSRVKCQRCHTATGFRNLANNPTLYDANKDETPDSPNVFYAAVKQREMLYCWACHTSVESGAFRDPGAMQYTMAFFNVPQNTSFEGRIVNVPDLGGSNICISCHSGRKTGAMITGIIGNFASVAYPHTRMAAGILFRVSGYENGPTADYYDNYSYFSHDRIGDVIPVGGSNGPCVACHMRSSEGHKMEAVTPAPPAAITNIPSYALTCSTCHGAESALVAILNTQRAGFEDALADLKAGLAAAGIFYNSTTRPYFFTSATVHNNTTYYTAWPNKDTLGVAFNFYLLNQEPGAYVHNSRYTKRLLYDAFDYLDDSTLNKSVTAADVPDPDAYLYLGSGTRP